MPAPEPSNKKKIVNLYRNKLTLGVGEEESHRAQSSNNHSIFSAQDLRVTQPASQHRSLDVSLAGRSKQMLDIEMVLQVLN